MNNQENTNESIQMIIAREFGFDDLPDEKQDQLIERMTESVIKRVLVEAYAKLSDADRKQFENMMEDVNDINPDSIDEFLREKLTDYDAIITDAVAELKKHITESVNT
jgi:hypothetical protein